MDFLYFLQFVLLDLVYLVVRDVVVIFRFYVYVFYFWYLLYIYKFVVIYFFIVCCVIWWFIFVMIIYIIYECSDLSERIKGFNFNQIEKIDYIGYLCIVFYF